jgi:hypothetical protein
MLAGQKRGSGWPLERSWSPDRVPSICPSGAAQDAGTIEPNARTFTIGSVIESHDRSRESDTLRRAHRF